MVVERQCLSNGFGIAPFSAALVLLVALSPFSASAQGTVQVVKPRPVYQASVYPNGYVSFRNSSTAFAAAQQALLVQYGSPCPAAASEDRACFTYENQRPCTSNWPSSLWGQVLDICADWKHWYRGMEIDSGTTKVVLWSSACPAFNPNSPPNTSDWLLTNIVGTQGTETSPTDFRSTCTQTGPAPQQCPGDCGNEERVPVVGNPIRIADAVKLEHDVDYASATLSFSRLYQSDRGTFVSNVGSRFGPAPVGGARLSACLPGLQGL